MANNILKEAIADAKAVREVALANAKAALEEAFTPRLQSMLSAKLSEELDEGEDKEEIEETYMEDKEEMDENMYEDEKEDLDEEIDLEEILSELELDEGEDSKEETVDEAKDKDEKTMDEAKDEEEEKIDEMQVNYKAETANRAGYAADYVHEGNENFDLDTLLEEINNLDENEEDEAKETTNEWAEFSRANPDISFNLNENGREGMEELFNRIKETILQEKEEINTENIQNELEETKAALTAISTELNEVNLLNSKLLYVNRIFKANTLNEAQKLRVVETLDNASNVKEAKLIYETIKDTFTISKGKKVNSQRSIKEGLGMASKAAGMSTAPKKAILNESNDMVARMQKLANIKINQ